MITLIMYVIAVMLLVIGEAIALAKHTDKELPITDYLRPMFTKRGPLGFLGGILILLWLGWHFLIDVDGSLPF